MIRLAILVLGLLSTTPAMSRDLPKSTHNEARYGATDPRPWSRFCAKYRGQCDTPDDNRYEIRLDDDKLAVLGRINKRVNADIRYETDQSQWGVDDQYDLPITGRGDCEDIALQKRKLLIQAGFPARALLLTVVEWRGSGHAVLTVVTDHGDLLLDNHTDSIKTFDDIDYKLIQRQDPHWLARWKRFEDWRK